MFKYTANAKKKLETVFKEGGYKVRYEKGNFQPGYCILENKKVVVINKYYALDAKINSLIEILDQIDIETINLSETSRSFLEKILASKKNEKQ